jgi:tetratricopeptide (TPR) repeat protein
MTLKSELAELYTAAGRSADASKLYDDIAKLKPNDPRMTWEMGKRLQQAGKNAEAVDKFIEATLKDPSHLENDFYIFLSAVAASKSSDKAIRALMKVDLQQIGPYHIGELLDLNQSEGREPTEAAKAFLDHLLKDAPVESLSDLLQTVGNNRQLAKTEAMANAVKRIFASDSMYDPSGAFFSSISFSSGGTISGSMQSCLNILKENKEAAEAVRMLLAKRVEVENSRPIASVLTLALDLQQDVAEKLPGTDNPRGLVGIRPNPARKPRLCEARGHCAGTWQTGKFDDGNR